MLYRDGYFISAVMVSQAVNEGIVRFIAEKNNINIQQDNDKGEAKNISALINEYEEKKIISSDCAKASKRIYKSFRNNIHHMNPEVAKRDFKKFAKRNIQDLTKIETEIFGLYSAPNGEFIPKQPKYWEFRNDGKIAAYLRF